MGDIDEQDRASKQQAAEERKLRKVATVLTAGGVCWLLGLVVAVFVALAVAILVYVMYLGIAVY